MSAFAVAISDMPCCSALCLLLTQSGHFGPRCDSKDAVENHMGSGQMSLTIQILMTILLVVLPYGTAIICGAITQWAGKTVSGWCSIGGLALGIYFFHKSMELFVTG